MRVRDALRASSAIPFYFSPVKSPFAADDLLVDGCITDCGWRLMGWGRSAVPHQVAWCCKQAAYRVPN
jgi:hypothetical protein